MTSKKLRWLSWLREQELAALKEWLTPKAAQHARLLEVGGGDGFLAQRLAQMGFEVVSIDPKPRSPSYFPVVKGDCTRLEFEDKSFDVIFSSNVLEHISDLDAAFSQMKRVLKKDGIMVHTVPTHYSTIYTIAAQPIGYLSKMFVMGGYALRLAFGAIFKLHRSANNKELAENGAKIPEINSQNIREALKVANPVRLFVSWPHGTSRNCLQEISDWKPESWRKRFEQAALNVKDTIQSSLAYSRHGILPFRLIRLRKWLASHGRNACEAYLLEC
jgi:ubiquinone/menaquinone biosynthesis C-methylase UbiE